MTTDEKSHLQTQITRDLETFIKATTIRAQRSHNVTLTDQETRTLIADALNTAAKAKP